MSETVDRPQFKVGDWVKVWLGAFVGSPGVPPEKAEYLVCEVQRVEDSAGQIYVWPRFSQILKSVRGGGKYVCPSAVVGRWPNDCGRPRPQSQCLCGVCLMAREEEAAAEARAAAEAKDRLHAATPELLFACKAALERLVEPCGWDCEKGAAPNCSTCNQLRAAIAKVEGGGGKTT
jgi:hypothetical protein